MEIRCPNCGRILKDYEIKSRWCNSCNKAIGEIDIEAQQRAEEERLRAEEEKKRAEELKRRVEEDKKIAETISNAGGYWEYKIVSLVDAETGYILPEQLEKSLNELGELGWHLRCAYCNELGHNSNSSGAFGVTSGTNATIDQNILIFERFVKQ